MSKKQKLRCRNVDACPGSGDSKPNTSIPLGLRSARRKKPDPIEPEEVEIKGSHMNVRDLGNEPGQVKPQLKSNKQSYTEQQMATSTASESKFSKLRARKK